MNKKLIIFIIIITLFSLIIRLYRINEPKSYYFDEVYHVVTARGYANNVAAAYDPFSPAPEEDTAYDWLHPPFAKLIQALSIKVVGDNEIGWRLPSAIFGAALIPAVFILAYLMFGSTVAIFSSTILAFENLTFVMSRITMNDIFLVFFVIGAFIFTYLYSKHRRLKYLLLTSIFLGLALATKWSGVFAIGVIFGFLLFYEKRYYKISLKLVFLIFIPLIVYILSYSQYFLLGYSVNEFIGLHKQIWWYQNRSDLEHTYGSTSLFCAPHGLDGEKTLCPWIFNIRPVYFSYTDYEEGKSGYIYALGNPMVFWLGVIAISYMVGKTVQKRSLKNILILLAYFVFWVPWIFSPRILFLYHYLPSIPFIAIALGYEFRDIYRSKFKHVVLILMIAIAISFLYLFPISSGLPIDSSTINRYLFIPSWR